MKKILHILIPHKAGIGGPGSFQIRFEDYLIKKGHIVNYMGETNHSGANLIVVVGGTRRLFELLKYKIKGIPILFRLDGFHWLHKKKSVSFFNYFTTEYRNFIIKTIHGFLSSHIIYQSYFVQQWWDRDGFIKKNCFDIIYNGVDTLEFTPLSNPAFDAANRLICVEGTLDYSPYAISMLNYLAENLPSLFTIDLYGGFEVSGREKLLHSRLMYHGKVLRENVPEVMRGGIYLSMDVNAACPNSVIEALSSGCPVVGFDTGSLKELVDPEVGMIVPFGGNPWNLDTPDFAGLKNAILRVSENYNALSKNARSKALSEFSIEKIMQQYLEVMYNQIKKV